MHTNPFFYQPLPSDPATIGNMLIDALGGVAIVAFVVVAVIWLSVLS